MLTAQALVLASSVFLTATIEFIEVFTILLVVGSSLSWRSAFIGAGAALTVLSGLVAVFGLTLPQLIPVNVLHLLVGVALLLFGLKWLKEAILRASGWQAPRDESSIYQSHSLALDLDLDWKGANPSQLQKIEWAGIIISFKSMFMEGLEIILVVMLFGSATGEWASSIGVTALAGGLVAAIGWVLRKPLQELPNHWVKFVVALTLVSFGVIWAGLGLGLNWWPNKDIALLGIACFLGGFSALLLHQLGRLATKFQARLSLGDSDSANARVEAVVSSLSQPQPQPLASRPKPTLKLITRLRAVWSSLYRFMVGGDALILGGISLSLLIVGVGVGLALTNAASLPDKAARISADTTTNGLGQFALVAGIILTLTATLTRQILSTCRSWSVRSGAAASVLALVPAPKTGIKSAGRNSKQKQKHQHQRKSHRVQPRQFKGKSGHNYE